MAQDQLFADEYKVNLDVFEGPLDLLLYLIRREELDIYDIPIEHITAEYMKFIDEAREMNLDIAGEFIVMAATLMVIKSRMLLPVDRRSANEGGDEEWVDPRLDLVRQLIEYKKFKDAAIRLETLEALASTSFDDGGGRPTFEKTAADARGALANLDLYDLLTAFQEVIARANEMPREELKGVRFSVPDKMDYVLERARREGQVSFVSLFDPERAPKGEIIVTFLALLELLRQHRVIVYQNAAFHEITILPSKEEPEDKPLERPDDYE
ncbi:MAG: segregation/condensation protein A [Kiritimatiellae bacterium]|nr:segregation/condensation protein A [Kiritimatiellia bacterium]